MKCTIASLFLCSMFLCVHAQNENIDSLKEKLIALEKQSWEAWKNQDANFYAHFLSDDHIEMGFYGASTKNDVVSFIASHVCKVESYNVSQFSLNMLDSNVAVLTYRAEQNTMCHNIVPSPVWVSSIYINKNGTWLNSFYQQTQAAN